MLDDRIVRVKVTGMFACFTRPDLKVERMTYPCMTPSAARGILDSILWKPEFQWYVRCILVLNPVKFATVKRNEINSKQSKTPIVVDAVNSAGKPKYRSQRNSVVLKDVAYIIEASIYQKEPSDKNRPEKYIGMASGKEGMFPRRVKKGQCWRRPYLGTREFAAEFMEPNGNELSGRLFDRVTVNKNGDLPRKIADYKITVNRENLPSGIQVNEWPEENVF